LATITLALSISARLLRATIQKGGHLKVVASLSHKNFPLLCPLLVLFFILNDPELTNLAKPSVKESMMAFADTVIFEIGFCSEQSMISS
jgi:hypothetical protein